MKSKRRNRLQKASWRGTVGRPGNANGWQNHRFPTLLKKFKPEEIFNTDETGLFYRCMHDKTHVFENKKCAGCELSRLTVLVTASMIREKLPLLVDSKKVLRLSVI